MYLATKMIEDYNDKTTVDEHKRKITSLCCNNNNNNNNNNCIIFLCTCYILYKHNFTKKLLVINYIVNIDIIEC